MRVNTAQRTQRQAYDIILFTNSGCTTYSIQYSDPFNNEYGKN